MFKLPKEFIRASSIGLNLVLSTFVGLAIGYFLDRYFNTSPWLTVVFLVLGIVAGFRELWRFAKKEESGTDREDR